jgi:5'(3')-deoxyribonucleotidase
MRKQIIAIDIDDVLADSTDALRRVVNERLGVNLKPEDYHIQNEDYWNHYVTVWKSHGLEGKITLDDLEPMMVASQSHVFPHNQALKTLQNLKKRYELIIVTSRPPSWRPATEKWLGEHFPNIFGRILFTRESKDSKHTSKGEICANNNVDWLIDDNVEHAQSAADMGIEVILFGDYGWHHKVPPHFQRCKTWRTVLEYFDAQG